MTDQNVSDYFKSNVSTAAERRRYAQNSLILDTAIAINQALEALGLSQKEVAKRLQKTEGFVSQVLSGGANLTLRTLADFAYSLDCEVEIGLQPKDLALSAILSKTKTSWTAIDIEEEAKAADIQLALAS